jgi:hypothetical protein
VSTVEFKGPIFEKNSLEKGIKKGFVDVLLIGQKDIQEQLYPGHGFLTGALSRSILGKPVSMSKTKYIGDIKSSNPPIEYTYWVETGIRKGTKTRFRGYHMFRDTFRKLTTTDIVEKTMLKSIMKALGGK